MKLGDKIKLIPITRHGKNRVHEHGDTAVVVHMRTGNAAPPLPFKPDFLISSIVFC